MNKVFLIKLTTHVNESIKLVLNAQSSEIAIIKACKIFNKDKDGNMPIGVLKTVDAEMINKATCRVCFDEDYF